jgi:transcriptional regulator with XRE-family HTH domain
MGDTMPEVSLDPKALAERIAAARKAAGKTQEDAAALLGLSRPTYIAIEKGLRPVQPQELVKLAGFFGRTVNELLRPSQPVALEPHLRAAIDQSRPVSCSTRVASLIWPRLTGHSSASPSLG